MAEEKNEKKGTTLVKQVTDPCPDCGSELIHQEGIEICRSCGWQSAPV